MDDDELCEVNTNRTFYDSTRKSSERTTEYGIRITHSTCPFRSDNDFLNIIYINICAISVNERAEFDQNIEIHVSNMLK